VTVVALAGCTSKQNSATNGGQPAAASAGTGQAAAPQQSQAMTVPASAAPDYIVTIFLNALRTGDSATTESLLTTKARQELAKYSMTVDPQSAPNAAYQVRPAEFVKDDPNGAHVSSVWTEKFDSGEETYEIVWVLRRQAEGWRLAGMALQLLPGRPMDFLNFEDPADMLKKKEEAIAAMQAAAAQTAQQPQQTQPAQRQSIER